MACCGSNGNPFLQTLFMGASVVGFSANIGWNGAGGSLQVELAEDKCAGFRAGPGGGASVADSFNPGGVGTPIKFQYGSFTYGGLVRNWRQVDSASGAKTYQVNLSDVSDLMKGYQVILDSYNGSYFGVPNLANVYGWLEATYGTGCVEAGFTGTIPGFAGALTYTPAPGFGGAFVNEAGTPWNLVRTALSIILNGGGGGYGSPITFRGYKYLVDLSDLPAIAGDVRLSGESMSLDDIVSYIASLTGVEYYYDLVTTTTPNRSVYNIIKVRTSLSSWQAYDNSAKRVDNAQGSDIDDRLSLGTIGQSIASSSCVTKYGRGLELKMDTTNAFITGEFRQEIWQTAYDGECDGNDTIWPYWGRNPDGSLIIGEGCIGTELDEDEDDEESHKFTVKTDHLGVGIDEWELSVPELREIAIDEEAWRSWCANQEDTTKIDDIKKIHGSATVVLGNNEDAANRLIEALSEDNRNNPDKNGEKGEDVVNWDKEDVRNLAEKLGRHRVTRLYNYLRRFLNEFYGKQFMVKLPFLCRNVDPDAPWSLKTNWINADSGWSEWPILGLPNNSWILENFRDDDGKLTCFVKFSSSRPMVLSNISDDEYISPDLYNAYVSAICDEIIWVSPTDARAIVKISGGVQTVNPERILPAQLLSYAMVRPYNGRDLRSFYSFINSIGMDVLNKASEYSFIMPVAAAIPLQSQNLVYGPWFAKKSNVSGFDFIGGGLLFGGSDRGQTYYTRETGYSPWSFGSYAAMNLSGYLTAASMLGDKYVVERGDITFPGSPTGALGSLLASGGPVISGIDVTVGRGTGEVTTTYRMKTYTPDFGEMARKYIDSIKSSMNLANRAKRIYKKYTLNRWKDRLRTYNAKKLLEFKIEKGLDGKTSHSLLAGQGYADGSSDYEDTAFTTAVSTEGRNVREQIMAHDDAHYRRKAVMESIGLFRPFSTLPNNQKVSKDDAFYIPHWDNSRNHDKIIKSNDYTMPTGCGGCCNPETYDGSTKITNVQGCPKSYMTNNDDFFSHEQVPPIYCKEHQLPINITTLSPFLSKGRSMSISSDGWNNGICMTENPDDSCGHDIEYIARDGVYPAHLNISFDDYSENHWYRGIALRGPLVLAGWGFDIDNKPVPNESTNYPQNPKMKFEENWLRKPQKWMCGPVDLRWDYKRNVWTAPTPMKIVKLSLEELLLPSSCANAILYDDQEQYDYDGEPIEAERGCGNVCGYRVKVYSHSMYPIPPGWRIMAYYDTTHNRYTMVDHDPLPLLDATLDEPLLCPGDTAMATINGVAGDCDGQLDPCGFFAGKKIKLTNEMSQPICAGRSVFVWVCGVKIDNTLAGLGEKGPTLNSCNKKCVTGIDYFKGVVLQAQFHPEKIVTHLELLEYFCWGFHVACDDEDIEIWSQGEVQTAWDWCLTDDSTGEVPSFPITTETDGSHAHTDAKLKDNNITGTFSATADFGGSHSHVINIDGLNTVASYTGYEDSHTHELSLANLNTVSQSGIDTNQGGKHEHSIDISGLETIQVSDVTTDDAGRHRHSVDGSGFDTVASHTTSSYTGYTSPGLPAHSHAIPALTIPEQAVLYDCAWTSKSGAHSHTYGYYQDCISGDTSIDGSHAHSVTISDLRVPAHNTSASRTCTEGTNSNHRHTIPELTIPSLDITGTVNTDYESSHAHVVSIPNLSLNSSTLTANSATTSHVHSFTIPSLSITGDGSVESGGRHRHSIPELDITGTATISDTTGGHSHVVNLTTNDLVVPSEVSIPTGGPHTHTFEVPKQTVDLDKKLSFDIDIASRFIPGGCVLRVSSKDTNYWEFFMYELCVYTRALWTEADMGPAIKGVDLSENPDYSCENIPCETPEYSGCVKTQDAATKLEAGRDNADAMIIGRPGTIKTSMFVPVHDDGILNLSTNCDETSPGDLESLSVSAECSPGAGGSSLSGSGQDEGSVDAPTTDGLTKWCNENTSPGEI